MNIQELGYQNTPLGELTLRRRVETLLNNQEVFEVKLGDQYLMSSLFTKSERQLATLGLAGLEGELDVVIGGLGLGYTAVETLKNEKVDRLLVIDLFQTVIDWHRNGLVPLGKTLTEDDRCELRQGDFFELARTGLDALTPEKKFDAILVDIDHTPEHLLNPTNKSLYTTEGLASIQSQIKRGGTFALWSDDPASADFTDRLGEVFGSATAYNVEFPNPYTNSISLNCVYVARKNL